MQLALDLDPRPWDADRFPNLERLRDLSLGTAVFYYSVRCLVAGDPLPRRPKLTDDQLAYVEHWAHPSRLRPAR